MQVSSHGHERRVAVLLPLPLSCPYDYTLQTTQITPPGTFVRVPLRGRIETGVVWHHPNYRKQDVVGLWPRLRSVQTVLDIPSLPAIVMRFIDWVAAYTLSPPGTVLKMVVNVPVAIEDTCPLCLESSNRQSNFKCRLKNHRNLIQKFLLTTEKLSYITYKKATPPLSRSQENAAAALILAVRAKKFSITLLEGGMGSGKTEVYFEAVAEVLRSGRQVLVLLPEIAFTLQLLDRFAHRFGLAPAPWHSEVTPSLRHCLWRAVANNTIRIVVGTRSALFLPYPNLGLIVVDEEHELAFQHEGRVLYNARDMAVVRGRLGEHAVILASATPSLETRVNVEIRRYGLVQLSIGDKSVCMPHLSAIDMRRTYPEHGAWGRSWLSPPLVESIKKTLTVGEQVMLFLNRRGYAPLTLCRTCGFRFRCPHCTAWLVEHRQVRVRGLYCHHCGYVSDLPSYCPHCGSYGPFAVCGPGVERLAEEIANRFPRARLALMTKDHLKGYVATTSLVQQIATGDIDIVIGTQIMTKSYLGPRLTLVGVVDADLGLAGGDLRAAERTFQLLSQVTGWARRGKKPGKVLIQTYDPLHPVMDALLSGIHERFYAAEAAQRRDAGMPPFGQLVALILSGPNGAEVNTVAESLAHHRPCGPDVTVLGPAPAPLAFLRNRHRSRLLLKTGRRTRVQPLLRAWLEKIRFPRTVHVKIDVNPYNFL